MALESLGRVAVATSGIPQRLTANRADPTARYPCNAFMVQTWHANTGKVFVGTAGINISTGVGVDAVIPIPTVNTLPTFSASHQYAPAAFNLAEVYVDVEVDGESVIVSAVV
jgi:hypothetical protein